MSVYPFIEAEKAAERNVARACALMAVSRSAFSSGPATSPARAPAPAPAPSLRPGSSRSAATAAAPRIDRDYETIRVHTQTLFTDLGLAAGAIAA